METAKHISLIAVLNKWLTVNEDSMRPLFEKRLLTSEHVKLGYLMRSNVHGSQANGLALGNWLHRNLPDTSYESIYNHEELDDRVNL